jgi:hypothetical protein
MKTGINAKLVFLRWSLSEVLLYIEKHNVINVGKGRKFGR